MPSIIHVVLILLSTIPLTSKSMGQAAQSVQQANNSIVKALNSTMKTKKSNDQRSMGLRGSVNTF